MRARVRRSASGDKLVLALLMREPTGGWREVLL